MDKVREIPSALMQQWEREALSQKIPCTEFGSFLRMKEENYRQAMSTRNTGHEEVFENDACNKLTGYGREVARAYILGVPPVERACRTSRYVLDDLRKRLSRGFSDEGQRDSFIWEREYWFARLKEKMREHRISKETLQAFGLDWNAAKSFAFQEV